MHPTSKVGVKDRTGERRRDHAEGHKRRSGRRRFGTSGEDQGDSSGSETSRGRRGHGSKKEERKAKFEALKEKWAARKEAKRASKRKGIGRKK